MHGLSVLAQSETWPVANPALWQALPCPCGKPCPWQALRPALHVAGKLKNQPCYQAALARQRAHPFLL
eukprot:8656679-Alexandrium_andersonii.AAC.1